MKKFSNTFSQVFLVGLLLAAIGAFVWRQDLYDWYRLRDYAPTAEVEGYVVATGMSDFGEKIFYVANPVVSEAEEFNQNCSFTEFTIVLGCYDSPDIFVLNIDDVRLNGVEEVTAAHEMLHAAYDRINSGERDDLDRLLARQLSLITNQRIIESIDEYRQSDNFNGAEPYTEMHSIFATEVRDLLPELEEHYRQYFDDRLKVVTISENYEKVFSDLEAEIDRLSGQITNIKATIDQQENQLNNLSSQLSQSQNQLNQLSANGNIQAYNQLVPVHNATVNEFNTLLATYKNNISEHNSIVEKLNANVLEQRSLQESLSSKFDSASGEAQ